MSKDIRDDYDDDIDDRPRRRREPEPRRLEDDAGIRMLLPIGRSGWAIAAGYFGLVSVLILPAPLALIFGVLAVIDIKKNPKKHGMGRAVFGIVMGAIFTLPLVLMLAAWAVNVFRLR